MSENRKRKESITTFNYPDQYNEKDCEKFINEWISLSLYKCFELLKDKELYFGNDHATSAAYESTFRSYLICKKLNIVDINHTRMLVCKMAKQTFWNMARLSGYIANRRQVYFPSKWVPFEEFFGGYSREFSVQEEIDKRLLIQLFEDLPDRESQILQMYVSGYEFPEIGASLNMLKSSTFNMFKRSIKKVKNKLEEPKIWCKYCGVQFKNKAHGKRSLTCSRKCSISLKNHKYEKKKPTSS